MTTPLKEGTVDNLHYWIFDSRDEMAKAAAEHARSIISDLQDGQDSVRVIFASAPSQNEFLQYLKSHGDINWSKITAFHMDEYLGLPPDAPQAMARFIRKALLDEVTPQRAHYLNSQASQSEPECARYASLLTEAPIDLVCLGVGENGHIAFNDPWNADFHDEHVVKKVELDRACRQQQVNDGCFARLEDVPRFALTLTIPMLVSARHLVCTVPAGSKRDAITSLMTGEIGESLPASILRMHASAALYLDRDSGANLL